jgi:hypothetical protein
MPPLASAHRRRIPSTSFRAGGTISESSGPAQTAGPELKSHGWVKNRDPAARVPWLPGRRGRASELRSVSIAAEAADEADRAHAITRR